MTMTVKELQEAIRDAEWRLGSYVASRASEGLTDDDPYIKTQISNITKWSGQLQKLLSNSQPPSQEG